jgi:hypothetical protein
MKDYAMFSPRGNELVHGVVQAAQREGWDWDKTQRHLQLLARAHPRAACRGHGHSSAGRGLGSSK